MTYSIKNNLTRFRGALFSGNGAAYMGILLKLLRPFTLLFDKKKGGVKSLPPIIFIVSPPRSGSTVIYQVLTRVITSVYFSNMHFLFPYRATNILFKKKYFNKTKPSGFKNYYGYTPTLNDVNEGNEVLDKLFNEKDEGKIRENFLDFMGSFAIDDSTPIIFKNVRNYVNIEKISRILPEVSFLEISRDYIQNIQSELKAYYDLKTFHPIPKELKEVDYTKDPVEFTSKQIVSIYKNISKQLKSVPENRKYKVSYEEFCSDPEQQIGKIATHFKVAEFLKKEAIRDLRLKASFSKKVSDESIARITQILEIIK